jgi:hypothetical protein
MTVKELLEERYILENLWPGCQWPVNTIFTANFADFSKYPYLVRKLAWHQERKEADLPLYVKNIVSGNYFKVKKWVKEYGCFRAIEKIKYGSIHADWLVPITEEEYKIGKLLSPMPK